ncbi:MAG: hypothetical protein AAF618_05970 [Pseudomonadota bacterium]
MKPKSDATPDSDHPLMQTQMPGWLYRGALGAGALAVVLVVLALSDGEQRVDAENSTYRTIPTDQLHQAN